MLRLLVGALVCGVLLGGRLCAGQSAGLMNPQDAAILLGARATWGGASVLPSWDASSPCEQWEGVVCDANGRAAQLSLPSYGLSGEAIPPSIGSLIQLQMLNLADNDIAGSLPTSLGQLRNLQRLDLSSNGLSGPLPPSIANLTRLTYLNLGNNLLGGSIPYGIGNLTSLQVLDLSDNSLVGPVPSTLSRLTGIQDLILGLNRLTGGIPSGLGSLVRLRELDLMSNRLTGPLPSALFRNWTGSFIRLNTNLFTGPLPYLRPDYLSQWDLSGNLLSGSCPQLKSGTVCPDLSYSCLELVASNFVGNCFGDCSLGQFLTVKQRKQAECSYACGSDEHTGPCRGQGRCYIQGPNGIATCVCNSGFVSPASNPGTCIPAPAAAPPPPRPAPPANVTQGVSFVRETPTKALNRWSRYLSANYRPQNGVPRWLIGSSSAWMAKGSLFLSYSSDSAGVTGGVLRWGSSRDQGSCAACWAMATTDAVAAARTIAASPAGGDIPVLSVPQVLGCSANGTSGGCSGDLPTTALEYAAASAVLSNASFQPGSSCGAIPLPPAIVMYEAVQFRGWFGLLLTLQKQPALAILEAGASFQQVSCVNRKLVFQDPSCYTGNLDHTVLVLGYDISALYPYWVVRNSWGPSWCDDGHMKLAIQGGNGVCGMNVLPAYYPVAAPPLQDPCYTRSTIPDGDSLPALNPCGGGTCTAAPAWGNYSYTCTCPRDFVAVNNTVKVNLPGAGLGITQTCVPRDACGLSLRNPCSVGTCVNDGRGSYSCLCPIGYYSDTTGDGQATCSLGKAPATLTVQPGVTCCLIAATYNITIQQILAQNPGLNCSNLRTGQVVNTSNPSYTCSVSYTVTSSYRSFENIANVVLKTKKDGVPTISAQQLEALNPNALCSAGLLARGQVICIRGGTWQGTPTCNKLTMLRAGDTCISVTDTYFDTDPVPFYALNPGIDCGAVSDPGPGTDLGATGMSVCLGSEPVGARRCPAVATRKKASAATAVYVGVKDDSCQSVLKKHCTKFSNRELFDGTDFLSTNKVPDCRNVKGFQFCCPA